MDKFPRLKAFLAAAKKVSLVILKKVFAPFTDGDWDTDPYKIGGFFIFGFALWLATQVMDLAKAMLKAGQVNAAVFAAAAGLVGSIVAIGYFLFAQGRQADLDLKKGKPAPAAAPVPAPDPAPAAQKTDQE